MQQAEQSVLAAMKRINGAWLNGQIADLESLLHPEIVMVFPGFSGRMKGREQFLAGFKDFCENAKIHEFHEQDIESDIAGDTAVVTFRYEMVYERSGESYRAHGRDLWVFQSQADEWSAVWRTMLDVEEQPIEKI